MSNQFVRKYNSHNVEDAVFEEVKPARFIPQVTVMDVEKITFGVLQIAIDVTVLTGFVACQLTKGIIRLAINAMQNDKAKVDSIGAQKKEPNFYNHVVTTTTVTTVTTTTTTVTHYDIPNS
ncbi:MAG: hypothetical protein RLZZ628_3727 [Bacteroidota bacterium]|jgi:hypothetical protein